MLVKHFQSGKEFYSLYVDDVLGQYLTFEDP